MEEFLVSMTIACWEKIDHYDGQQNLYVIQSPYEKFHLKLKANTESEDLREWPLSSLTAKEAVRARQPSSRHTPSHFKVWLVFHIGNYEWTRRTDAFN